MPIGPKRLPFFEHIAELRKRLIIIVSTVSVISLVLYTWAWQIYDFILAPVMPALKSAGVKQLNVLGPFGGFTLRFKVSMYAAIAIASPIIIWQVMAFFLPALKPKERKYVLPTFGAMVGLFLGGIVFSYLVILDPAFGWMVGQAASTTVGILPEAALWFQAVTLLMLAFGIGFQLPIIVFYLMIFDIVPYKKLRENWRVSYVAIACISAVATPDWSPVTMGALAAALMVLYEASMLLARVVLSKRIAEQQRRQALEDAGLDPDAIELAE